MNKISFLLKIFQIGLILFWYGIGNAQTQTGKVQQIIKNFQNSHELSNAGIGVSIVDFSTGEVLINTEPHLSLIPASILKVVTTATALEVFGPDYRFETTLSYTGLIQNDTLFGDLQILGGGDPTLGSKYFPENIHFLDGWIKSIESVGIKTIVGNLVLDATIYESESIPKTWIWEDLGNYFGAGASGISIFDNFYEIHLSSQKEANKPTRIIRINPEIPNLELKNEVLSSELNGDQTNVFGSPMDCKRIIQGTIPKNKSDFIVKASVPDPSALLASEFKKKLSAIGVSISGETKYEKTIPGNTQIAITQSPELREIIKVTNHESVNLFAEHLLKQLSFQKYGIGKTEDGCKFVMEFWKIKGLEMKGFKMNDGSGLSRFDWITARQMVFILNYMKKVSAYSSDFIQSLATAGSGTIINFKDSDFPDQSFRAKSGSMTRVRCYAGYLRTISGMDLSFAMMLNNFSCSQAEAINKIEDLLIEIRKL